MNESSVTVPAAPVADLIARLGSADDSVRGPAWQGAWSLGAAAVGPLIVTLGDADRETARAARRALWNIVDHSGRPGAPDERNAVVARILAALGGPQVPTATARELLWMLSTLGTADSVPVVAARLKEVDLREDARCVLQRFPGSLATAALREALAGATGDFACALADALRARGESIDGFPSRRLIPTKATSVGGSG